MLFAIATLVLMTLVSVGVARRLHLGSIVALLLVGVLFGPYSPWPLFSEHVADLRAVGEIGVMLLLFAVGLDIQPQKLWSLRRRVFGFAALQYVLTVPLILALLLATAPTGASWHAALVVALALAMSSAAIPLPILRERHDEAAPHAQSVIAIEIFQSLALVPVLAVIALLGATAAHPTHEQFGLATCRIIAAVAGVWLLGRYALPWALGAVARRLGPLGFALTVLAGVCLAGGASESIGVSAALGAFMTGVLLSTSFYAEQVKAAVAPTRQILLALFFIALGMAMQFDPLLAVASSVLLFLPALLAIKFAVLFALSRFFGLDMRSSLLTGALMMPFDEIAYVILASAQATGLLDARQYAIALSVISFSFVLSPLLIGLTYRLTDRMTARDRSRGVLGKARRSNVVVFGCGNVGRAMCTLLERAGIDYAAFDHSIEDVKAAQSVGLRAFYADLTDSTLMQTFALAQARLMILATPQFDVTRRLLDTLRHFYGDVPVMTAVEYLAQRDELRRAGATYVVALAPEGTLAFGREVLDRLAVPSRQAVAILDAVKASDYALLRQSQ